MTIKNLDKLAFSIAVVTLFGTAIKIEAATAETITYDFLVDTGTSKYKGYFSYDDMARATITSIPYFPITDFSFDFIDTNYQNAFAPKTYTESDLQYDGRIGPYSYPLFIPGAETIIDEQNGGVYRIARGGPVEGFSFSTFSAFDMEGVENGWWTLSSSSGFNYLMGWDRSTGPNPNIGGSGIVSYWLRPSTSVPEPNTVLGLSLLGLGWVFSKKKNSRTNH
ncbi:MAG TPA: PEP-CTERM sorting domain-containing protein [Halomicronema sp.]